MSSPVPAQPLVRIASLKTVADFRAHAARLGLRLDCEDAIEKALSSPLARPIEVDGRRVGNRWCIHPMEGWGATPDGHPTECTTRRWQRFGQSGAKLIWSGEARARSANRTREGARGACGFASPFSGRAAPCRSGNTLFPRSDPPPPNGLPRAATLARMRPSCRALVAAPPSNSTSP
jgi:hypothetical protein